MCSKSIHSMNSGADVECLQFDVTSQKWIKNKTDNQALLSSIVWQYNKITCSLFSHKFPIKLFFV